MAVAVGEMSARFARAAGSTDPMARVGEAFRELDGALRRFLMRSVRCPHDAEDLAQEVYLRMARHPDLGAVESLQAFAWRTALNLVRDRSRRLYTRSRASTVGLDEVELAGGDDPLDQALRDERLDEMERSLAAMPPARRQALLMHRFEDCNYAEIARILGVSVSMVEKHISAALADLRQEPDFRRPPASPPPARGARSPAAASRGISAGSGSRHRPRASPACPP